MQWISKLVMLVSGALIIGFAYMFRSFEGIAEACSAINSVLGGPTMGLFTLGIFVPFVFQEAALIGILSGLSVSTWKYVGAFYYPPGLKWSRPQSLDTSLCSSNATATNAGTYADHLERGLRANEQDSTGVYGFYHTSYCYLGTIGFLTTITVAICIASIVNKRQTGDWFVARKQAPDGTTWSTRRKEKFEEAIDEDGEYKKKIEAEESKEDLRSYEEKNSTTSEL